MKMNTALIVVDMQNDFIGGPLPVPNAEQIIPRVNKFIRQSQYTVWTQDCHPADHISFKENGGLWAKHCVRNTDGAQFHPNLLTYYPEHVKHYFIYKGKNTNKEEYSAFEGDDSWVDDAVGDDLNQIFTKDNITHLFVCGIATDYCVKHTVLDALKFGYNVDLLISACAGVSPESTKLAIGEMVLAGCKVI
jgi:nicotinamidase/pyrazinamidase